MDEIIDINTLFGPFPSASSDLPVDTLLALMRTHNVRAACTLSSLGFLLDPSIGNAATRAACADHPELLPAATFNPVMFFGDAEPLRTLREEGFRLLRFFPGMQHWMIDFAPFHALLESINDVEIPIMVQIDAVGEITDLLRAFRSYTAPVILGGVDRTTISEAVAAMRTRPNWHVEISNLLSPGCIHLAVQAVGSDRILFGSGAPAHPVASILNTLRFSGLDGDDLNRIASGNARRVLNLVDPA